MNKVIYFIGSECKGTRFNPYSRSYNPIVAVTDTMEKAVEYCEKWLDYHKGNYEQSGFFKRIETGTPFKIACKFDYQTTLTFDIRKRIVPEENYKAFMENKNPYYTIY